MDDDPCSANVTTLISKTLWKLNCQLSSLRYQEGNLEFSQSSGAEKLEKADILELTVEYLKSSANHKPWVQSTNIAWTYFLAGYTSCEENLRQLVDSTVPTCSGVKMASLITTIESQKLQAVYNFLNAFNQQIGSPSQPPASSADTSEGCTRGKNVVWRPWR
nr:hypothetical transcript [Hymenolepis microstoma]